MNRCCRSSALAIAGLACACSNPADTSCPPGGTTLSVSLTGGVVASGTLSFPKSGGNGTRVAVLDVTLNVDREGSTPTRLSGPMTCEAGIVRARFAGASEQKGRRLLGGVLEGIYQPRLIPLDLVAAVDAIVVEPSGTRGNVGGQLVGIVEPGEPLAARHDPNP